MYNTCWLGFSLGGFFTCSSLFSRFLCAQRIFSVIIIDCWSWSRLIVFVVEIHLLCHRLGLSVRCFNR
jgi:hypothetical protein